MLATRKPLVTTGLLLVCILLLAFFLRSYHIESTPAGLYPDEAVNAIDAIHAIETGDYKLFYPNNYGREALFINLQALALKTFGMHVWALKFWSMIFGTLAVLGTFLLAKELFKRSDAGLIAAFMLATSFWAINFSRIGFRAIMVSFIISFTFYFFFKGFRTQRFRDFLWSGLFFGLGLHTYIAFRLAPLILIILLPVLILSYESFFKRFYKHILVFCFGAFVAAAPMLYHFFIAHPEDFISRTGAVSIFSPEVNGGHLWLTLGKTVGLSLMKYNFWGDQNWRHNYPPYPILDPLVGTLFLAGFLYLVWHTVTLFGRLIRERDRDTRLVTYTFILGAFFVMLIPEFLTNEGLPHALRAIGTQVPVFLMATLPALWLWDKAHSSPTGTRVTFLILFCLCIFGGALINVTKYFVFFAQNPNQHGAFNENYTNMARYLLALPPEVHKYVLPNAGGTMIDNGLPVTAEPIVFLTYHQIQNLTFITPETLILRPASIIMMQYDDKITNRIQELSPDARIEKIDPHPGLGGDFTVITLPALP